MKDVKQVTPGQPRTAEQHGSEKERIEQRLDHGVLGAWYVIAKSAQLVSGKVLGVRALSMNLVLWRGEDGAVRCIEDHCPHRGAPLSRGRIRGNNIACAYHGVELTGEGVVRKVPALPGCALEGRKLATHYLVQEHNDGVFVWFPSETQSEPIPLKLPYEFTTGEYTTFLTTNVWECNYQYALDNIADPMHGCYLHGDTFTLSGGSKEDTIKLEWVDGGFTIARTKQQGENFDWAEVILDDGAFYSRVNISYPRAGGPGGMMRVVSFVTPIDERNSRIFFWRCRKVSGLEREAWRFMFRTTFEPRHWEVLEQDRGMLSSLRDDARRRESLYQHDIGITRLRQQLQRRAREQVAPHRDTHPGR